MAKDDAGLTDEIVAELNPGPEGPPRPGQLKALPDRPGDSAAKAAWVDYVVALGADRAFVEGDTTHWSGGPDDGELITVPGLTLAELRDLADRLGG